MLIVLIVAKKFLAHCVLNEPAFCERQKMFRDGAM